MAAVRDPEGRLVFCIDRWEVVVEGELGDTDQWSPDAVRSSATARSVQGATPSGNVSWGQARAICANSGKRLPTSAEWEDAADGRVGAGGQLYPYGDHFDPEACACLDAEGQARFSEPQPTGSLPGCQSPFGTWDQSGNLFEWADPERSFDIGAWLAARPDLELEEGRLLASSTKGLLLDVAGVDRDSLGLTDGALSAWAGEGWRWDQGDASGVLRDQDHDALLPVELHPIGATPGPAWIRVRGSDDGAPLADKRGGSYYSGTDYACRADSSFLAHLHDFEGTIGFRCALDP